MFRVVVKSNLTQALAENLADKIENIVVVLDSMDGGYQSIHSKITDLVIDEKLDADPKGESEDTSDRRFSVKGKRRSVFHNIC